MDINIEIKKLDFIVDTSIRYNIIADFLNGNDFDSLEILKKIKYQYNQRNLTIIEDKLEIYNNDYIEFKFLSDYIKKVNKEYIEKHANIIKINNDFNIDYLLQCLTEHYIMCINLTDIDGLMKLKCSDACGVIRKILLSLKIINLNVRMKYVQIL